MPTLAHLFVALATTWLAGGCASTTSQVVRERPQWTADSLYPLAEGHAWSFDVDSGDGDPVLAVSRVVTATPTAAVVATGREQTAYEQRADGIYRPAKGGYLLKEPIRVGATWSSGAGMTATVSRSVPQLETPAGQFEYCAEVEEHHADTGNHIWTIYCPNVGPVRVVSEIHIRNQKLRVTATLRGYASPPPSS